MSLEEIEDGLLLDFSEESGGLLFDWRFAEASESLLFDFRWAFVQPPQRAFVQTFLDSCLTYVELLTFVELLLHDWVIRQSSDLEAGADNLTLQMTDYK